MPSYGPYPIFNESWIERSTGGLEFLTDIEETRGKEYRNAVRSQPRAVIDLQGLQVFEEQWQEILAFQAAVRGMWSPFLIRDVRNHTLDDELIATGDGSETEFQVQITRTYQGIDHSTPIKWLDEDYPALVDSAGNTWRNTEHIVVKVNGVTKTRTTDYVVDRETGIIEFMSAPASGHPIRVTGNFYTLVRCNTDIINGSFLGGGVVEITDCSFIEPVGGL